LTSDRPGTHAALSGGTSRRSPTSRLCSSRKRAQSARRSSDTNSPGSSGSGEGCDPAGWFGPELIPHLRCGNCGTFGCGNRRRTLGGLSSGACGDSTTPGPIWNDSQGDERKNPRKERESLVASEPSPGSFPQAGGRCARLEDWPGRAIYKRRNGAPLVLATGCVDVRETAASGTWASHQEYLHAKHRRRLREPSRRADTV
jgi:hypothetical protein